MLRLCLLCTASWLWAAPVFACKCMQQSPEESFAQAVAVFEGQVMELREPAPDKTGPAAQRIVKLRVVRAWKGVESEVVDLQTASDGAACGYAFAQGVSYLVYAFAEPDGLRASSCSRTRPMGEASEDLAALGMGATPVDPKPPEAPVELEKPKAPPARGGCASCTIQSGPSLAASGWLVAATALGLCLRVRRTRAPKRAPYGLPPKI